jgi:hypothetical protein
MRKDLVGVSLAKARPELVAEWHFSKNGSLHPADVLSGSNKKAWWRCSSGHEWSASISQRTRVGTGCPYCLGRRVSLESSLAVRNPSVAKTWHPTKNEKLRASDVSPSSSRKVWWLCRHGHEWQTSVLNRVRRGDGCPMCSGRRLTLEHSLATVAPDVVATWHPTRNGRLRPEDVSYGSGRKVWRKCPKGSDHEWRATVRSPSGYTRCPFCLNRRLSATNSLAAANKAVAREWHPTQNGKLAPTDVVYGSTRKAWWRCKRGHEWFATISSRTGKGAGCRRCRSDNS